MKRFFTFLMAVWALLSISQMVKADDVTVYFQCPGDWNTPVCAYAYNNDADKNSKWDEAPEGSEYYTSTGVKLWQCTFDSKYKYVIFKEPGNNDVKQYPGKNEKGLEVNDNYVYTSTPKGDMGTLSEFVKNSAFTYTLTGGYGEGGDWSEESANFQFVGDGNYTYTFTATQTGEFRFRVNTSYTSGAALCPNVDFTTKRKELTSTPEDVAYNDQNDASGKSMFDNYWFCNVTNGKKYTFTLTEQYNSTNKSYTRKLSVVAEEKVNPVITADAGYYLVGNFFSKHNIDGGDPEDEINYSRLYFKFKDNGIVDDVHTYSMDIPASISAYMQILSVDDNNVKVVYGPGEIKAVSAATLNTNTSLTGTTLLKSSDLSRVC